MSGALLSLWVALIGADRFDFAGGHAFFTATPFIILTPLLILSEMIRRRRFLHPVRIPGRALIYAAASAGLISVVLTSVIVARQIPASAARVTLLLIDVMGTFAIALLCADRSDLGRLMARGALLCLPLFLIFNVVEAMYWIGLAPETMRFGPLLVHIGPLQSAGPLPRLGGPTEDANRGGFVLVFYLLLIARWEPRRWLRRAGIATIVILLILTFSRSTSLAAITAAGVAVITTRRQLSIQPLLWTFACLTLAAGVFLWHPGLAGKVVAAAASPLSERLSASEGSAPSHLALIRRGLKESTSSIQRSFTGLGYGNSYLVLQDYFPGNRYGNFHSLFVTMFAESGILAMLLMLALTLAPLTWAGPWRALVAGSVAFNLFYQTTTEPSFWFILAAAWIGLLGSRAVSVSASSKA